MANRLARESSPYLLQHKDNPVDWYPWGEEALARARAEDRPILLSIGYSACHWCHVMEHESFEDVETAALMNRLFVPIKVDREERPDLDSIYMEAVQRLTGQGGWPMTMFLTPDGRPFYGGTYYPPEDRHGMPGFKRVLLAVDEAYRERREDMEQNADGLISTFGAQIPVGSRPELKPDLLSRAVAALAAEYDDREGGFGHAPKFPQPMTLEVLLRAHRHGDTRALPMVERTLAKMARGGIYDQLGGGFHRYSTDSRWLVPHFEKMLYDNSSTLVLYSFNLFSSMNSLSISANSKYSALSVNLILKLKRLFSWKLPVNLFIVSCSSMYLLVIVLSVEFSSPMIKKQVNSVLFSSVYSAMNVSTVW